MSGKFEIIYGHSPIVLSAIHDGHKVRDQLYSYLNLAEHERSREEDPYTGYLTEIADSRIIVQASRFEVDMNRPRNQAVYLDSKDAWGLSVWKSPLPPEMIETSLDIYDAFYLNVTKFLRKIIETFGHFVIIDVHTYNHRRENIFDEAPSLLNPEINIGTVSVLPSWRPLIQDFIINLTQVTINNHKPDVRENVKFLGGEFCRWINQNFGQFGCAFAVEFKKIFMDEWTGLADIHHLNEIQQALALTLPHLRQHLNFNLCAK